MPETVASETVRVAVDEVSLEAALRLPDDCLGLVIFAHAGSNSRLRPPNDYVASVLQEARLGTLWVDLLLPEEARSYHLRTDLGLLAARLRSVCLWARRDRRTRELGLGIFGVRTSAAAALQVAAARAAGVGAVVARGGPTGMADRQLLARVHAPTLLIVGGLDVPLVQSNRAAYAALHCPKRLDIIPGATHAFEEPGNQEVVARLARAWFLQHARLGLQH